MEHLQHLKPAICKNCGQLAPDKYCSNCGQRTTLHHDSLLHLIGHFFADYFHYDSKFLSTLKLLLARPGELTRRYISGMRASYLNPIQLYVFISAVFFLVFFQAVRIEVSSKGEDIESVVSANFIHHEIARRQVDTTFINGVLFGSHASIMQQDTARAALKPAFTQSYGINYVFTYLPYYAAHHQISNLGEAFTAASNILLHSIPRLFFILMPLLALLMKWSFRRKGLLFVDYAVASIHFHAFGFISFMVIVALMSLPFVNVHYSVLLVLWLVQVVYFIMACKRVCSYSYFYSIVAGLVVYALYICLLLALAAINLLLMLKLG